MKTNKQLLQVAKNQLGKGGAKYRAFAGLSGGPWCESFVYWLYNANGCGSLLKWTGSQKTYCPDGIRWCDKNLALVPPYLALPCDIIYFDWEHNGRPNHVGIVESKKSTSEIRTIEGNTSGGIVARKNRDTKYVQGGVYRPHFAPSGLKRSKLKIDGDMGYNSIYMLQDVLGMKPTGILTKETVKYLQRKAGATPDGQWGPATSRKVQKMVGAKQDGQFGAESVRKLQTWTNAKAFPAETKKPEPKPSKPVETKPTKPAATKKGYSGTFPTLPTKTAKNAVAMAYAYGTKLSVYKYHGGKPKENYRVALKKAYPDRSRWGAQARAGASCDVFVGTDLRASGYKKAPRGLREQKKWIPKNLTKVSKIRNGDILLRSNHVAVFLELKGKKFVANAHHEKNGGTYGIVEKICKYSNAYRPKGSSYFSKGDTFTDVKKLQKFLNWYGGYKLKEDYIFGSATDKAVRDFQKKTGLAVTGKFGADELKKARAIKK